MSVIAKSLKKVKTNASNSYQSRRYIIKISQISYYDFIFYFIIIIFFLGIIILISNYFFLKKHQYTSQNINLPLLERKFYLELTNYKHKSYIDENKIKYLIKSKKINLLKKQINLLKYKDKTLYMKYLGILNFLEKKLIISEKILLGFLQQHPNDYEVLSYLAKIYFLKGDLNNALKLYNKITLHSFEIYLNQAIIFEKLKKYKISLKMYQNAYLLTKDPLLKRRIFNKIFLMTHYE